MRVIKVLMFAFYLHFFNITYAQIPKLINYQGKLNDANGLPVNGTRSITFSIYESAAGGSALWSETHASVTVTDGIFSILLGSVTDLGDLDFDKSYYLGIKIGSGTELTPRKQIVSAAYAMRAENANNADLLDGMDSSNLLQGGEGGLIKPKFIGYTKSKVQGGKTLGGKNNMCYFEHLGAHMCTLDELIRSGWEGMEIAWINGPQYSIDANCRNHSSFSSSDYGYLTKYGFSTCDASYPIACCK